MRLTHSCPLCGKPLELLDEKPFLGKILRSYKCGHSLIAEPDEIKKEDFRIQAIDGSKKKAREYQIEGVKFLLKNGGSGLIADQMRLGKTPQSLLTISALKESEPQLRTLILVRSANLWQWLKEYKVWTSTLPLGIFMIQGSKSFIPPGFDTYIMSMDTISRKGMVEKLQELGINCIIIDECHSFKNPESKRSQALVQFLKDIQTSELERVLPLSCISCRHQWKETTKLKITYEERNTFIENRHETKCPQCGTRKAEVSKFILDEETKGKIPKVRIILLSGTPIKNRADEYFIPLNLLAPEKFPSITSFRRNWLMQDEKGKWSRIQPWRMKDFQEVIKPFVLRRERKDVWEQVPKTSRNFIETLIEDENLKKLYNAEIDKIAAKDSEKELTFRDIQENLMTMRRIVGMAKVQFTIDLAESYLEDEEDEKLCIGIHHHGVRDALRFALEKYRPLVLSGEDSAEQKYRIVQEFNKKDRRLIIINQLAGGVGTNDLYCCNNIIMTERQWSSADEEQFEDRFQYMDKTDPINYDYIIAKGTLVDEWWTAMVEGKRSMFNETMDVRIEDMSKNDIREMVSYATSHRL